MDMKTPEMTQPMVATMAPAIPAICRPTKVDVLTARGPEVICENGNNICKDLGRPSHICQQPVPVLRE